MPDSHKEARPMAAYLALSFSLLPYTSLSHSLSPSIFFSLSLSFFCCPSLAICLASSCSQPLSPCIYCLFSTFVVAFVLVLYTL